MDNSRVFDGFAELSLGMAGGKAPDLVLPNQVAEAVNATFRGSYVKTRPPLWKDPFTFENAETQARFTGKFQGALFYQVRNKPAHILSRGGKLFRIEADGTNFVSEITPRLPMATTAEFTVPAIGAEVVGGVLVTSEVPFTVGQQVIIDSGLYTVTNKFANGLNLEYNGGAAGATVAAGAAVLDSSGNTIFETRENPAELDFVFLFQAVNYVIVLASQHRAVIYDGSSTRLAAIAGEVPPGILGIYVWGRIWVVLPNGVDFMAGDLLYSTTQVDASDIIRFTENDFFNEGGTFGVPFNTGEITAMQATAVQDNSLGQGPLLVGTDNSVFSVNAPVDRTIWKDLQYPIQTVALGDYGPLAPRCVPLVNGDMWYRSADGIRSYIVARREIQQLGQTPMSRELDPVLEPDTDSLLFYASGIVHDNRLLVTVSPHTTVLGIAHSGLAVLNLDLISNIRGKLPPAWDGAWSGFPILQMTKGKIARAERAFAWVANETCLELWEIKKAKHGYYDQVRSVTEDGEAISRIPIQSRIATRAMDFRLPDNLKGLRMGELYIDDIVDDVTIRLFFKPDRYPSWVEWATIQVCASVTQCTIQAPEESECQVWTPRAKTYAARIRIQKPSESCNDIAGIPVDRGYDFQFKLEWTGSCTIPRFRVHANVLSQEMEGECPAAVECKVFEDCGTSWFDYSALPMCS